jgi:membrane-associated protease RseP (regulator of RpoE activity)
VLSVSRLPFVLALLVAPLAWVPSTALAAEQGTFLGVLVRPVGDQRDARTEIGPVRPQGVCVTEVLPDSPAARASLRPNDILLRYDNELIRDGEHLARLISRDRPTRKVKLRLLREGREQAAEVTLTLGPPLTLAPGVRKSSGTSSEPAGVAKPAAVGVIVTPLEEGKLRLTIESKGTGKVRTITCAGATELKHAVDGLPEHERELVRIALQRLGRAVNSATPPRK